MASTPSDSDQLKQHFETLAVHAGVSPDPTTGAIMTPIFQNSTYAQRAVGEHTGYEYSRTDNPTRTALQSSAAALEGGLHGLAFASGMAATDALVRRLRPGDHVLCGNDVYGGTYRLFDKVLAKNGLEFTYVDTSDLDQVRAGLQANTRLIWLETPTNPMLRLTDISAVADLARARGALLAVDNTFASPALQRPLLLGADVVVHSSTKYLGGHSDVVGGLLVVRDEELYEDLKFLQNASGAVPGPMDCFLTLRGIKTLPLRMKAHCDNAQHLSGFLVRHPAVREVIYPGLESHPHYQLAQRQMAGGGGIVSFIMDGGEAAARTVAGNTKVFTLAESLGGVESLIEVPAVMTHASVAESSLAVDPGLVRISVGIENAEDLQEDLSQALSRLSPVAAPAAVGA